jgi:peptidoglycan/xylan/chitin deacetylase (PgdA/CDA1 family)
MPKIDLWFDDGYAEVFTKIRPLLKEYDRVGILAIVTSWVGKKGFMTIADIRILLEEGWKVASHSVTHHDLTELSPEEIERELRGSKEWIEEHLSIEPIGFVAPFNKITYTQKKLALKYYKFVRSPDVLHFHANWGWVMNRRRAVYEWTQLRRILSRGI